MTSIMNTYSNIDEVSKPLVLTTRRFVIFSGIIEFFIGLYCLYAPIERIKYLYAMEIFDIVIGNSSRLKDIYFFERIESGLGFRFKLTVDASCVSIIFLYIIYLSFPIILRNSLNGDFYKKYNDSITAFKILAAISMFYAVIYAALYFDVDYDQVSNIFIRIIMNSELSIFVAGFYFSFFFYIMMVATNAFLTILLRKDTPHQ